MANTFVTLVDETRSVKSKSTLLAWVEPLQIPGLIAKAKPCRPWPLGWLWITTVDFRGKDV